MSSAHLSQLGSLQIHLEHALITIDGFRPGLIAEHFGETCHWWTYEGKADFGVWSDGVVRTGAAFIRIDPAEVAPLAGILSGEIKIDLGGSVGLSPLVVEAA